MPHMCPIAAPPDRHVPKVVERFQIMSILFVPPTLATPPRHYPYRQNGG